MLDIQLNICYIDFYFSFSFFFSLSFFLNIALIIRYDDLKTDNQENLNVI